MRRRREAVLRQTDHAQALETHAVTTLLQSAPWDRFLRGDYDGLKRVLVEGETQAQSFGRLSDVDDHIDMLEREFIGRSYLELFHAIIIVFIRRGIDVPFHAEHFNALWNHEKDFLSRALDIRWLISACDTIVDTSRNGEDVATAYAGTLFMNTIKLHETELIALKRQQPPLARRAYDDIEGHVALFGGMSAFVIGRGDMIANLYMRARAICRGETPAQVILAELLDRANQYDTVFKRFRGVHINPDTLWPVVSDESAGGREG